MNKDEFDRLRDGKEFSFFAEISSLDVIKTEKSVEAAPDDYIVVYDNSQFGEAQPDEEVRIDVEFTLERI